MDSEELDIDPLAPNSNRSFICKNYKTKVFHKTLQVPTKDESLFRIGKTEHLTFFASITNLKSALDQIIREDRWNKKYAKCLKEEIECPQDNFTWYNFCYNCLKQDYMKIYFWSEDEINNKDYMFNAESIEKDAKSFPYSILEKLCMNGTVIIKDDVKNIYLDKLYYTGSGIQAGPMAGGGGIKFHVDNVRICYLSTWSS